MRLVVVAGQVKPERLPPVGWEVTAVMVCRLQLQDQRLPEAVVVAVRQVQQSALVAQVVVEMADYKAAPRQP
jgi:hypothetical protein